MFVIVRSRCALLFAFLCAAACDRASQVADVDAQIDGSVDAAPRPLPVVVNSDQRCKLLNNARVDDPTPNQVQFRANVLGADLGIPVVVGTTFYLLFGDTIGFAGIWGNESHPDAVGYAVQPASAVAANPALLCDGLGIVTLPPSASIGPGVDSRIEADFAGAAMIAPAGHRLDEYIHNPAGGSFANLPGDFEVPSGAFTDGGALYAFYTTVVSPTDITMIASYLARWDAPSTTGVPAYQILYGVDDRTDAAAALRGDFINIAAVTHGADVYLFGTGAFRASPVHLARKPRAALASPGGFERFDAPIIATAGYGETSVQYFAAIDRWMFLAEELTVGANRIVARFADRAEGPWSDAIVVHDMADAAFTARYCCAADACHGVQFMNCNRTGFYGAYLFPDVAVDGERFTVTYTLSSFDPYNVALFQTTFGQP